MNIKKIKRKIEVIEENLYNLLNNDPDRHHPLWEADTLLAKAYFAIDDYLQDRQEMTL